MPLRPPPAPLQLEPVGAAFRLVMARNALESPLTPRLASKAEFLKSFDLRDDEISEIFSTCYKGDQKRLSNLDTDEEMVFNMRHQLFIQSPSSSTTALSTSSNEVLTMVTIPDSRDSSSESNASSPSLRNIGFDRIYSPPSPLLIIEAELSGPMSNTTLILPNYLHHLAGLHSPKTNTQELVHRDAIGAGVINHSQPNSSDMNSGNYAISPPVRPSAEMNKTLPHLPLNPADVPTNSSSNLNPKHFDHSASLKQKYEEYKTSNPPTPRDDSVTPNVINRKKSQFRLSQPSFPSSIYFKTAKGSTLPSTNLEPSPTSATRASLIFRGSRSKSFKRIIRSPLESSSPTSKMSTSPSPSPSPTTSPTTSPTVSPTSKRVAIARMFSLNRTKNREREKSITKTMISSPSKLFSSLRSASSSSPPSPVPHVQTSSPPTRKPVTRAPHLQLSEESLGDWKEPLLEFFPGDEPDSSSSNTSLDEPCVTPSDSTNTTIVGTPKPLKETQPFANVTTSPTSDSDPVSPRVEALEAVYNQCFRKVKTLRQELERASNDEKEKDKTGTEESMEQQHRSIQDIELDLAAAEKERYESGLLLNKAYQRQRKSGGTDFWVRSVGIA